MSLLLTQLGGGGDVSGTGQSVQRAQTSSAIGSITINGTAASVQKAQTGSAAGTITISGAGSGIQKAQTASATGTITITGTGAGTQKAQTSSASGTNGASETPRPAGKRRRIHMAQWSEWIGPLPQIPITFGESHNFAAPSTSTASGSISVTATGAHKAAPATSKAKGRIGRYIGTGEGMLVNQGLSDNRLAPGRSIATGRIGHDSEEIAAILIITA